MALYYDTRHAVALRQPVYLFKHPNSALTNMTFRCVLIFFLLAIQSMAVILIREGATTREISLARPYRSATQFRKELMGKSRFYNLDFTRLALSELKHLPTDLYGLLNVRQVHQLMDRCKVENGLDFGGQCRKALYLLFGTPLAIKEKRVNWLRPDDFEVLGYDCDFMPLAALSRRNLQLIINRWSRGHPNFQIQKELQAADLRSLVGNAHLRSMRLRPRFFRNLHAQQTIEHWPRELANLAKDVGVTVHSLYRGNGVTSSDIDNEPSLDLDASITTAGQDDFIEEVEDENFIEDFDLEEEEGGFGGRFINDFAQEEENFINQIPLRMRPIRPAMQPRPFGNHQHNHRIMRPGRMMPNPGLMRPANVLFR